MSNDSDEAEDGFADMKIGDTLKSCLNCGIIVVDSQGVVVSINADAAMMLGGDEGEFHDQPVANLPESVKNAYEETLSTGKNISGRQFFLPSLVAQERRFNVNTSLIRVSEGEHSLVVIRVTDLGAARKLEHNMRRLDRLARLGTLSAGYAHELKNALVSVNTFLELATLENPDCDLSATAAKGIKRINSLVQQLNHMSAPSKASYAPVSIHGVLEQSLTFIRYLIKENSIELKYDMQAANDLVAADAYQLEQAFLNMLFNAIDALGPGGSLTLESRNISGDTTGQTTDQLQVSIRDTGVGISPENMDRLFETFFTTKQHGTGLGLAISGRILKEHGGDIRIESSVNVGTSVLITLPLYQPAR